MAIASIAVSVVARLEKFVAGMKRAAAVTSGIAHSETPCASAWYQLGSTHAIR